MGLTNIEELEAALCDDTKVKVAGIDADGVMRGKVMSKEKFMSAAKSGFGFCRYCPLPELKLRRQRHIWLGYPG